MKPNEHVSEELTHAGPIGPGEQLRITRLETFQVKPNWLFLKIHTDAGISGWGEPVLEGRARTCAEAVRELEPYLLGQDPRNVVHHWHAMYRHAFYRGGEILTSALSGVDMALWDIKGKSMGVPVYSLFGGPTRNRIRVYTHSPSLEHIQAALARGFRAFKTKPALRQSQRFIATPSEIGFAAEQFGRMRRFLGDEIDIAIDFHGAVSPATSKLLIRALEPHQPMFVEEPCLHQNVDVLADIARSTCLPIAAGERVFTKWGFREILEKRAASVLQPDLAHAGGITEVRLIAGMAEAYYAVLAPHNPLGPIALAAAVQLAASIPNFLIQEQVTLGEGLLTAPFTLRDGLLDVPTAPGLGIEPDEEAIRANSTGEVKLAGSYDEEDGSVGERHGYQPPMFPD
jgi:galactonate dehydratase